MPVVTGTPYDTVEYVMNLARARANDMIQDTAGNLLSDSQPYTLPFYNAAWRQLQRELTNRGVETLAKEAILTPITPITSVDPGLQVYISWDGYFNGTSVQMGAQQMLPLDMVGPLRMWERPTNSNTNFIPMQQANDGIPSYRQFVYLRVWEWRGDSIWMQGATQSNDLRLRYNAWFQDVQLGADFSTTLVPIVNCAPALAWYIVAEFSWPRGSEKPAEARALALAEVDQMCMLSSRTRQRTNNRRVPYSRRAHGGWGWY